MFPYPGNKVYQGCKNSIARGILLQIPSAEHFYDLFGGSGSVSITALGMQSGGILGEWRKWNIIHYNELNTGVFKLCREIWEGTFDIDTARKTWITRKRFFKEKDEQTAWGAMVKLVWSFGAKGDAYIYGENIEIVKYLLHIFTLMDWVPGESQYEKKIFLRQQIGNLIKKSDCFEYLEAAENFETLERLETLEHLQTLEHYKELQDRDRVIMSNLDYRLVHIEPNSVVYCDIPYPNSNIDYQIEFSHADFYEWARSAKFPVYFSSYENSGAGFECVWKKEYLTRMSKKDGKAIPRTECLFFNGVKI